MAVATAASQHHALSSVLRIPPLPSIRVSHTLARLSTSCPPPASLSLSHSLPFACFLQPLSLLRSKASSSSPHSRSSVYLRTARLPFETISLRRLHFFICLSLSSVYRFFCPPTSDGEREKDEENGGGPSSSSEPSLLSPSLPRGTVRVVAGETIARYKWIRDTAKKERQTNSRRR